MPWARATVGRSAQSARAPRGRLARYSLFHLTEFAGQTSVAMLLAALGIFSLMLKVREAFVVGTVVADAMMPVFALGVLLAVTSTSARDRAEGFHRFLFSKPVSISGYYSYQFASQLIGFVGTSLLIMLGVNLLVLPYPILRVLVGAAVLFVGVGGPGFFLATFTRRAWLWLIAAFAVTPVLLAPGRGSGSVWRFLLVLLPPVDSLGVVRQLVAGLGFSMIDLLFVVGYGLAAFAAGLLVLRKRTITA